MIILKEEDCTVWLNFLPFIYQNTYQSDNSKEIEIRNRREGFFTLIAVPLYSPLLRGVAKRPCFWGRARRRKHARHHAHPRDGLKTGSCTEGSY